MALTTKEEFAALVAEVKGEAGYKDPIAFGITRVDRGQLDSSKILQATYPVVNWDENFGSAAVFIKALRDSGQTVSYDNSEAVYQIDAGFVNAARGICSPYADEATGDAHKNVQVIKHLANIFDYSKEQDDYKVVFIYDDANAQSVEVAYLKLYALSLNKVALRSINLNGIFGLLHNVAWSGNAPIELEWLRELEIEMKLDGTYPHIDAVDKFPRFLQHVIPADNTRILESSKVRMGAQLAAGTTVMPGASYINFNAGTLGAVMVEGRISSSAIVGAGSDVGGGASILGVLSGTDGNPVSIGENTLLGANSVTGIPLGDGCIVDAGMSVLEGTKIQISTHELEKINTLNGSSLDGDIFKGLQLAGLNGIHYRQNSVTGAVNAFRSTREVTLNADLH